MNDDRSRKRDSSVLGALHELAAPFVITVSVASVSSIGCGYGNPGDDSINETVATESITGTSTGTSTGGESDTDPSTSSSGATTSSSSATSTSSDATSASTATAPTSTSDATTDGGTTTDGTSTGGVNPGFNPEDPAVQICADPYADDPVDIISATIKGDLLALGVGYSGGCEDHLFGLCWDGLFAESDPVQVSITLGHDAQGDGCEAYITEEKVIDLGPMRQAWIDAYGEESGTITINITGADQPIDYSF